MFFYVSTIPSSPVNMGGLKDGNVELCRLIFVTNKLWTCKITILEQFVSILKNMDNFLQILYSIILVKNFWYLHVNAQYLFCNCHKLKQHWYSAVVTNLNSMCGAVVITTAQLYSTKPELRFRADANPACSVLEILNIRHNEVSSLFTKVSSDCCYFLLQCEHW